ncbi:hypothetical protein CGMCC3_g13104 [Colletotrichum fructicola]|nr:uncharacterized protein CGMCC3_g13104 [Colletotrichum fructicola]KAE9570813.1 hypothetical protein CGMCC3_g13104 [Colletotrichum fructicola]
MGGGANHQEANGLDLTNDNLSSSSAKASSKP